MNEYEVSVIIPVYNAERYLRDCVDSVLRQTLRSLQIVLVNDGSDDASADIVARYAAAHDNIVAIHQTNQGVEKARAAGFRAASGAYIGWVDADDIAKPAMFETLYALATREKADFVYCDYEFFPKQVSTKTKWFKEYRGVVDADFIDRNTQCWNTLVRRDLYEKVRIDELLPVYSEYSWIAAMLAAGKIAYTKDSLYCYRVGHNSVSGGAFTGRVAYYQYGARITKGLKQLLVGTPYAQSLSSYFDYRYIYTLLLLLLVAAKNADRAAYREARAELRRMRYLENPYLDRFVAHNYGRLKAWVITRLVPSCYALARPLAAAAL